MEFPKDLRSSITSPNTPSSISQTLKDTINPIVTRIFGAQNSYNHLIGTIDTGVVLLSKNIRAVFSDSKSHELSSEHETCFTTIKTVQNFINLNSSPLLNPSKSMLRSIVNLASNILDFLQEKITGKNLFIRTMEHTLDRGCCYGNSMTIFMEKLSSPPTNLSKEELIATFQMIHYLTTQLTNYIDQATDPSLIAQARTHIAQLSEIADTLRGFKVEQEGSGRFGADKNLFFSSNTYGTFTRNLSQKLRNPKVCILSVTNTSGDYSHAIFLDLVNHEIHDIQTGVHKCDNSDQMFDELKTIIFGSPPNEEASYELKITQKAQQQTN
jgi:hypothetical protein